MTSCDAEPPLLRKSSNTVYLLYCHDFGYLDLWDGGDNFTWTKNINNAWFMVKNRAAFMLAQVMQKYPNAYITRKDLM